MFRKVLVRLLTSPPLLSSPYLHSSIKYFSELILCFYHPRTSVTFVLCSVMAVLRSESCKLTIRFIKIFSKKREILSSPRSLQTKFHENKISAFACYFCFHQMLQKCCLDECCNNPSPTPKSNSKYLIRLIRNLVLHRSNFLLGGQVNSWQGSWCSI